MMDKPSDILDVASSQTQKELESILKAHRERSEPNMTPKGTCYYCDEPNNKQLVFCDEYCRDDYDYDKQRRKANGR